MRTVEACKLSGDRTEEAGRRAGRGNSAVVTGLTVVGRPDSRTISLANSYHVQSPALVTCTIPWADARQSCTSADARSRVKVGLPRWSFTTEISGRVDASFRIVAGKHLPPWPKSQDVRAMQPSGRIARSRSSARALLSP